MEIKPIFIIRMNGQSMSPETLTQLRANLMLEYPTLFEEYYVMFSSGDNRHPEFECYHPNDIPEEVRSKTLELINDIINKQTI